MIFLIDKTFADVPGWNFSDNREWESIQLVLYSDYLTMGENHYRRSELETALKNFVLSEKFLDSLIQYNPALNQSLYINGKKIYQKLVELTEDKNLKTSYKKKLEKLQKMEERYDISENQ